MPGECVMSAVSETTTVRRFSDVEDVSDDIFGKVLPFPHRGEPKEDPEPEVAKTIEADEGIISRFQDLTEYLSGAFAKGVVSGASLFEDNKNTRKRFIVVADENQPVQDAEEAERQASLERKQKRRRHDGLTSYLTLPDHVEMLEVDPQPYDDEATMAAIRKVMVDQRREFSRLNLPELRPANATNWADFSDETNGEEETSHTRPDQRFSGRIKLRIIAFLALGLAVAVNPDFFKYFMLGFLIVSAELALLYAIDLILHLKRVATHLVLSGISAIRNSGKLFTWRKMSYSTADAPTPVPVECKETRAIYR